MKYKIDIGLLHDGKEVHGSGMEVRPNGDLIIYDHDWSASTAASTGGSTLFSVPQKIVAAFASGHWRQVEEVAGDVMVDYFTIYDVDDE